LRRHGKYCRKLLRSGIEKTENSNTISRFVTPFWVEDFKTVLLTPTTFPKFDRFDTRCDSIFPMIQAQVFATEDDSEEDADSADTDKTLPEVEVVEHRAMSFASDSAVRRKDFENLPRQNPSDLVRIIPGVHVSQHTGGAKAYQYFIRGFDAEHGQDLAAYLDGIPLNEPSQVYGHGYLDLHFLVPETLESIEIIKGPYNPEHGNFATAGAINFIPRRSGEQSEVSVSGGMYNTARILGTFAVDSGIYRLVGAVGFQPFADMADAGVLDIDQLDMAANMDPDKFGVFLAALYTLGHLGEGHCAYSAYIAE